ncbi:hypothetical protein TEA_007785 [Camellia sinensis var. sinensis]|uniref:ABC transporter B family member 8 n=1 Tax=Camellia sinensis var. sinensis TaxID=542762 RepID=A0A4S4EEJ3_CAMSN|nr:hypothetical protein TEA_007785 [Camellia sinensis var. sinensis]
MSSKDKNEVEINGEMGRKERKSIAIMLRCADRVDILLMVLGTLGAIGDGMSTNCLLLYVSRLFNSLGYGKTQQNHANFMAEIEQCSLYFVYLGLAVMVVAFMEGYCWSKTSERQVLRIRYKYLEAVLRQEVGFFDSQEATTSEIVNSISKDTSLIQEVLSEKVPKFLMHISQFISGLAFSTYFSWRLSLVAFPTLLLLVIPGMIYGKYLLYLSDKSFKEYGKANTIVEQALGSIKTVYSFTAEKNIVERYSAILDKTTKMGIKKGIAKGLAVGSTGLSFAIWAFLAWYGSRLVMYKGESGGQIYTAGIAFIMGGLSLGVALPEVRYLTEASVAASQIFNRINRIPEIDGEVLKGLVLDKIRGEVEFEHVKFTYPSRPDSIVGERGALLSGGQKQRIAIARAIIKNPVILLLDEATSALDSESESLVQNALDQASMGRTTLVVAHKLSTVRNADLIAVMSGGCIIEIGSHNDLINIKNGHYAKLAKLQRQFSSFDNHPDDQDQHSEPGLLSVTRSSAGRLSTGRSSPAFFSTPHQPTDDPQTVSHPPPSFSRLLSMNSPEWKQGLIGSLSAIIFGAVQPVYALTIGGMISAFFSPSHEEIRSRIRTYCLIFSSLSLISIVVNLLQHYNFAYMGEQLTKRIRLKMLEKILTFEASWFDEEKNSSGALCARLSNEASMVKSLVADRVSLLVQTVSAVTVAMVMGLAVAWKLALVMIAVQPLTILCFYTRKVLLSSISMNFVKAQNQSTQIAVEAVYNHRIVTSFGSIQKVLKLFDEAQDEPRREAKKKSWLAGIGIGSAQCLTFMCWALDFWYGGILVNSGEISSGAVFKTFFILVSTGKVIAEAGSMTSDIAKGSTAVASVFAILDRQSLIPRSYTVRGQKQRIAIARAIIRNPTILLLDEATSALDVQSEQVVQEALDQIMVGRTTVVVAHRLNTIKNLDSIAFVADGALVERGTYAQLKNKRGAFFNLASLQNT